jgi:hypothetical protein
MDVNGDGWVSFAEFEAVLRAADDSDTLHPDELATQMSGPPPVPRRPMHHAVQCH